MSSNNELAQQKAERALALIERAQNLLALACEELCPIHGAVAQWRLVGKHYGETKALWHKVNDTLARNRIGVDDCYLREK